MKNPLSDKMTHLRYSLIHGLMQNIEHNVNNGIHDLMLFEHGNTFSYSDLIANEVTSKISLDNSSHSQL